MPALEELHSVVTLLERRVQELRKDHAAFATPVLPGPEPSPWPPVQLEPESPSERRNREAIVRLYEEAMDAVRFDLRRMQR